MTEEGASPTRMWSRLNFPQEGIMAGVSAVGSTPVPPKVFGHRRHEGTKAEEAKESPAERAAEAKQNGGRIVNVVA